MLIPAWTRSLRFRLTAGSLAAVAAIILLASGLCYGLIRSELRRETDAALADGAAQVVRRMTPTEAPDPGEADVRPDPAAVAARADLPPVFLPGVGSVPLLLRLARRDTGVTRAVSPSLTARPDLGRVLLGLPLRPRGPGFAGTGDDDQMRVMTVAVPNSRDSLQVAAPWDPMEDLLTRLLTGLGLSGLLFLLVSGVGSWLLVGRALRPIDRIVREAEALTADRLGRVLLAPGAFSDDEIGHLVDALNRLLSRLSQAFAAQRRFTADASHELRTPLTILRGEMELALSRERLASEYRRTLESGLEETARMTRIVESLSLLAHGDAENLAAPSSPVSLDALASEATGALARQAADKGLSLRLASEGPVVLMGDADALRRMLRNLIENALAYTPPGGMITVTVAASGRDARVVVADTGVGIGSDDLPRVFDRFYRADKARANTGGSGLGLSIVLSIASSHGGTVQAESVLGEGSVFTVTLPKD